MAPGFLILMLAAVPFRAGTHAGRGCRMRIVWSCRGISFIIWTKFLEDPADLVCHWVCLPMGTAGSFLDSFYFPVVAVTSLFPVITGR